jgi:hypothetical protein
MYSSTPFGLLDPVVCDGEMMVLVVRRLIIGSITQYSLLVRLAHCIKNELFYYII